MATRVAVIGVWLNRAQHRRAHDACHATALLWNTVVDHLRAEWRADQPAGEET